MPAFLIFINNNTDIFIGGAPLEDGPGLSARIDPDGMQASALTPDAQLSGIFDEFLIGAVFDSAPILAGMIEGWGLSLPVTTYRCVLTGVADGLSDIVLQISNFQFRSTFSETTDEEPVEPIFTDYWDGSGTVGDAAWYAAYNEWYADWLVYSDLRQA